MIQSKLSKIRILLVCTVLLFTAASTAYAFGKGAKGPDVYVVQGMLKSLGYYSGPINGTYGEQTGTAVKSFQRKYALPVTGKVDDKTLESILWAYANLKLPKKPVPAPAPIPVPSPQAAPSPQPGLPPTPSPSPVPLPNGTAEPEPFPAPQPSPIPAPQPVPLPSPQPTTLPAPKPPTAVELTQEERQLFELVNKERAAAGLAALTIDIPLSQTARLKSRDMVDHNYFSHESPTFGSLADMLRSFGISYKVTSENIACNQGVEAAHEALMNSQEQRAKILGKNFTHIGVGIVDGGACGKMLTLHFAGR